ncbi:MAG: SDR family NAD(P)-dependent oxidoreductase, partial [Anaerolineales bacterium]
MKNLQTLPDKVAVITGGAQGLGAAISLRLAQEGCKVVVADIKENGIIETEKRIHDLYAQETLGVVADVTKETDVEKLVDETVARFGKLDIIVSNAGILIAKPVDEFPANMWMKVLEVNLFGYFL